MPHHVDWERLQSLLPAVREYQRLAAEHGINDIFQDNGGKILQMLLALGLQGLPGREGNDAVDADGNEYELKSVNLSLTSSFSTHHHINPTILAKYRKVEWFFAVFQDIEMRRIYRMETHALAPIFEEWETKWYATGKKDINNPKIQLTYVIARGVEVFSDGQEFDLRAAARVRNDRRKQTKLVKETASELAGRPHRPARVLGKRNPG